MTNPTVDPSMLATMEWRSIGPFRGGRTVAVAGHPTDPLVFYFGACAGGVWKTSDAGAYWENVSDGFFSTAAVGAIAVAESDPNVLYAGTGEACIRGNVSHGDGVYRSTDGGKTWKNAGLQDTRHIGRVRVHPNDPDLVYVAALGHAYGPNDERGVFRSRDGGGSWECVLFRSNKAGAVDLSMDPRNPRILYAAIWETVRTPWSLTSGGDDSGLYRSTDGGDTWTELSENPGMPAGIKGRIGVAVSPVKTDRVWVIVEAEEGGLLRSDDGGESWETVSADRALQLRPWYYSHVFADPHDAETVHVLNTKAWKSTDGGRTFAEVPTPHGDNHDLWIDAHDPQRMIEGNDGGACVSLNGGDTWSTIYNQPTAQFYHVATDTQFPYRVYATQQDNSAVSVPSRSHKGAIHWSDCYPTGNSESGHIAVRPDDPNIVYSGAIGSSQGGGDSLLRYNHRTGEVKVISIWPELYWGWGAKDLKYRFQWTYPILISPHDPNVLYAAGNVLFKTEDEGMSWRQISPDLTRNERFEDGGLGRPHHPRHDGRRALLHDLRVRRIAARAGRPVVRVRRWPRPYLEGRRHDLAQHHAEADARMDPGRQHRAIRPRPRLRLHRSNPVQAGRQSALPLQDKRLWGKLDGDIRGHPGGTTSRGSSARTRPAAACCTPAPRPASTSPSTTAARGSRCSVTCLLCRCSTWP